MKFIFACTNERFFLNKAFIMYEEYGIIWQPFPRECGGCFNGEGMVW